MKNKNIVPLLILLVVGVALLYSQGYLKSTVSSPEKDYSLNIICQNYNSCLAAIEQKIPNLTDEKIRQSFNCDSQGCYWIGTQEVAKK